MARRMPVPESRLGGSLLPARGDESAAGFRGGESPTHIWKATARKGAEKPTRATEMNPIVKRLVLSPS